MPHFKVSEDADGVVIASESPTGERLEAGDVFIATPKWYQKREECPFLEPISVEEYRDGLDDGSSDGAQTQDDLVTVSKDELDEDDGPDPDTCQGVTADGSSCTRQVGEDESYCFQHK